MSVPMIIAIAPSASNATATPVKKISMSTGSA